MEGRRQIVAGLIAVGLSLGLAGAAQAALINRGVFDGVTLIYDSTRNLTWFGDANYAQTSGFDADGRLDWFDANDWAAGLTIGGFTGWRLPRTLQPDPTCSAQTTVSFGTGCEGSEKGAFTMQLLPNELALANLRGEIPEDERGYCTVDEAYDWLK